MYLRIKNTRVQIENIIVIQTQEIKPDVLFKIIFLGCFNSKKYTISRR